MPMDNLSKNYILLCEHITKVLDAYKAILVAQEKEKKGSEKGNGNSTVSDYEERFYQLVNHKNKVL